MTITAVIIPGGGINDRGEPNEWVKSRLDKAIEKSYDYYIVLSRGSVHKPNIIDESTCMSVYLINNFINSQQIIKDNWSLDTIGNAYFCSIITSNLSITKLTLITSDFHFKRCNLIFNWIYSIMQPQANLSFIRTENKGLTDFVLNKRIEKENGSIRQLLKINDKIKNRDELCKFIFLEHMAYNSQKKNKDNIDDNVLQSY